MSQDDQLHMDEQGGDFTAALFASALLEAASTGVAHKDTQGVSLSYLDVTVNGEAQAGLLAALDDVIEPLSTFFSQVEEYLHHA